jgi:hypothetical protein
MVSEKALGETIHSGMENTFIKGHALDVILVENRFHLAFDNLSLVIKSTQRNA